MPVESPGRTPTFFIVAAPKAGTTSLYQWCRRHPAVFMSTIKEPCFFAPEVAEFTPRSSQAYRWSQRPAPQRPTARERAMVGAAYDADLDALQAPLGRDLSHWRVSTAAASSPPL
jgi:hypothetical protein